MSERSILPCFVASSQEQNAVTVLVKVHLCSPGQSMSANGLPKHSMYRDSLHFFDLRSSGRHTGQATG